MSTPEHHSAQRKLVTPLSIIALFISLTEAVLGIGVIQTSNGVQIGLTIFMIAFPVWVAGTFFFILWKKPWVLYPPTEYGSGTDVGVFGSYPVEPSHLTNFSSILKFNRLFEIP